MTSMEESWTSWLCDLEADDYSFINGSGINAVDGSFLTHHDMAAALQEENLQRSFSADSYCSHGNFNTSTVSNSSADESSLERPAKLIKTSSSNSANTEHLSQKPASSPCSFILSFDNVNPPPVNIESALKPKNKVVNHGRSLPSKGSLENRTNEQRRIIQEGKKTGSVARSPHHTKDHIIAERMRREKITHQFIALSALIPGLKKMDKASVLGDAIKLVKQLQERVKLLEEQSQQTKRKSVESVAFVKKSQLSADEDVSDTSSKSCDGNSGDPSETNQSLPEVEARVSEKSVMIRIHCEKQKGVLMNIVREIEKLHLSVINSSALLFGNSVLDVTIIAETDDEFSLSAKELARKLRVGLLQFI